MAKYVKLNLPPNPRSASYAEKEGSYQQVFQIDTPIIKPGEQLKFKHFFSGYGEIKTAKIRILSLSKIFDANRSIIRHGFKFLDNGAPIFGTKEDKFSGDHMLAFLGIQAPHWDESTQFIDIPYLKNEDGQIPPFILTECIPNSSHAPIEYELTINKNCKPGDYYIDFAFTYFNGNKWCTDTKRVNFHVQNILERHQFLFATIATIASLSAIFRFVIYPILKCLNLWN